MIKERDTTQTQYLYNGRFGVDTDKNNLYCMRARYYNVNIKCLIKRICAMSLVGCIIGTGIDIMGVAKAGKFLIKADCHKYGSETAGMMKTGVSDA